MLSCINPVITALRHAPKRASQVYRRTWGWPATQLALANVSNVMVYDDHDIRDDLGDKPQEHDPTTATYMVVRCARRALMEYQRALHEDIDLSHPTDVGRLFRETAVVLKMGEYGLLITDCRGAKTFDSVPGDPWPFLTSRQWQDLHQTLGPGGAFEDVKMLVWATQVPARGRPHAALPRSPRGLCIASRIPRHPGTGIAGVVHADAGPMFRVYPGQKTKTPRGARAVHVPREIKVPRNPPPSPPVPESKSAA